MSKNSNVNPGHYKVAGRERQGEEVVAEVERAKYAKTRKATLPKRSPSSSKKKR